MHPSLRSYSHFIAVRDGTESQRLDYKVRIEAKKCNFACARTNFSHARALTFRTPAHISRPGGVSGRHLREGVCAIWVQSSGGWPRLKSAQRGQTVECVRTRPAQSQRRLLAPKHMDTQQGGFGVVEGASPLCVGLRGDWGRPGQGRRTPHCVAPLRAERAMPRMVA